MSDLINRIVNKDFIAAKNMVNEKLEAIAEKKMIEVKKMIAAKKVVEQDADFITRQAFTPTGSGRRERLKRDLTEESGEGSLEFKSSIKEDEQIDEVSKELKFRYIEKSRRDKENSELAADSIVSAPEVKNYYNKRIEKRRKGLKAALKEHKQGDTVSVPHKGKMVKGKIVRKEKGSMQDPESYVVDVGEPESIRVPLHKVNEQQIEEAHGAKNVQKVGRTKLIRVRIRGGKVQRRKKVSAVPGMTIRGGKMIRMTPAERRHRKLGARRGKIKRRAKKSQMLRKRKLSLMKRQRLGL